MRQSNASRGPHVEHERITTLVGEDASEGQGTPGLIKELGLGHQSHDGGGLAVVDAT